MKKAVLLLIAFTLQALRPRSAAVHTTSPFMNVLIRHAENNTIEMRVRLSAKLPIQVMQHQASTR